MKKSKFSTTSYVSHKLFLLFLFISFSGFVYANNTTYYIDNTSGNNSNNGTSSGTAWYDFTNVNSLTLQPGDQVLLKRGCTWNSELHLKGSGTSSAFIVVDAYGTGNKPKIQRNSQAADRTVYMDNTSYFKVQNIEICNAGDGIRLQFTGKGYQSIYFKNLYIHNINFIIGGVPATDGEYYSTGIIISASGVTKCTSVSDYVAQDIKITNCEIGFTTAPITFLHFVTNPPALRNEFPESFRNILIDSNYLHDWRAAVSIRDLNTATITNNRFINGATTHLDGGTCGFFHFSVDNVLYQNNVMDSIPNTGSYDQTWIDNEAYCNNVRIIKNTIKNTAGAGIEYLSLGATVNNNPNPPRGTDDYNGNNVINNNTFYNNGNGALYCLPYAGTPIPHGTANNNIFKKGNLFLNGNSSGFTLTNNNPDTLNPTYNLALYKTGASSSNYDATQTPDKALDGNQSSNWQSSSTGGFANQWLRADFGSSTTFDSVRLSEYANRTSSFRIEYSDDAVSWQTAYTGTTIGSNGAFAFLPVTGRYIRIYFVSGLNFPAIYELEVYNRSNFARSASPVASCTDTANGYSVAKAVNGNPTGFDGWACNTVSWFDLVWGSLRTFDKVELFSPSGYVLKDYDLQTWDGSTYTTIASIRNNTLSKVTNTFSPVTTLRLRVNCLTGDIWAVMRIDELNVLSSASSNPATVAASCTDTANGYSVLKAINGNTTDWDGWSCGTTSWFEITWPKNKTFDRVDLYTTTGYYLKDYDLQYWNGSSYTTLLQVRNNAQKYVSSTFSAVSTTKLRVYCITGDMYNIARIDEIKIFNGGNYVSPMASRSSQTQPKISAEQALLIYPNPAKNHAKLIWGHTTDTKLFVNIYDIRGRLVKTVRVNELAHQADLNTTDLNSGVYFIRLSDNKYSELKKLLILK